MKKLAALLPALCLALASFSAKAETLTFTGQTANGEIGPYTLTLGSTSTNLSLFCMNDLNYIQGGESWGVNVVNGANLTGPNADRYKEEAFIYSNYNGSNATDVQLALWKIFDSSENISSDHNAINLVAAAGNLSNAFYTNGSLANYTFYLYNGSQISHQYGDYPPQNFIGAAAAATPEPSSLALLGSGLLGLAGTVRRKMRRA